MRRPVRADFALLGALSLAGCHDKGVAWVHAPSDAREISTAALPPSAADSPAATRIGVPGRSASGCNQPAPADGAGQQALIVDGAQRRYVLVPPQGYDPQRAYPIVFVFHGLGADGPTIRADFKLEPQAAQDAFFVYPTGSVVKEGLAWALYEPNSVDMRLFDALLARLEADWCVDPKRIFAAGFSYGGWMATQLACFRPSRVRAVASVAGGGPYGSCKNPVAAMLVHGSADSSEPVASSRSALRHFQETNGCQASTSTIDPSPCVSSNGCKAGLPVVWCEHSGPHEVPEFARAGIWKFFDSLR